VRLLEKHFEITRACDLTWTEAVSKNQDQVEEDHRGWRKYVQVRGYLRRASALGKPYFSAREGQASVYWTAGFRMRPRSKA
jgi:hypothetical protein